MAVLDEVLAWSLDAPMWMRDALRRIISEPEIDEEAVEELVAICKKPHGLATDAIEPMILADDFSFDAVEGASVRLVSIRHIADVNALARGETLQFAERGLTLVYGDNGAGKSGYARILKRACRARGSSEPILANALSDVPAGTPSAHLKFVVGDSEAEVTWKDGAPTPAALASVSVFDTSAAQIYVADKTEVRFRPLGLDVLDRLAVLAAKIKDRLDQEKKQLEGQTPAWPVMPAGTDAANLLRDVTALTSRDSVDRLATLSEAEELELTRLEEVLATITLENPERKAADLRVRATRLRRLAAELDEVTQQFSADRVARIVRERNDDELTIAIAARTADEYKADSALDGLGTAEWRELWDAAKAFSAERAYPEHAFPHLDDGALCVLCQDTLSPRSKRRLSRFAELVAGKGQRAAKIASGRLTAIADELASSFPGRKARDAIEDLEAIEPDVAKRVESFLAAAISTRDSIIGRDSVVKPLTEAALRAEIDKLVSNLETKAGEIARAAKPAEKQKLESRKAALRGRVMLRALRPKIFAEIERKARINAYERCAKDTDTRGLSKLSTELTKKHVTEVLTAAFDAELVGLGFSSLELELKPVGAQRGNLYHQVHLKHATKAQLAKVVSEGENRCIALAAFLAELQSAGQQSTIVFDDPVSSLDHHWRRRVAERLAEAGRDRQVIVFTHEVVFLTQLSQAAERSGVPCSTQSVHRTRASTGHVDPELPWTALSTQGRIRWIKNEWQKAEKVFRIDGQSAYDPLATTLYAKLRQTWERAVEEILLNKVVERFRTSVETQRLKDVRDVQPSDLAAVETGMKKCSTWEGGHDQAPAINEPLPHPTELMADVTALENWVKDVESRRKKKG